MLYFASGPCIYSSQGDPSQHINKAPHYKGLNKKMIQNPPHLVTEDVSSEDPININSLPNLSHQDFREGMFKFLKELKEIRGWTAHKT